jgi:uncharacterized protein (TIGR03067 family)
LTIMNERAIFLEALDKTDTVERSAYLDQACGGDAALRQRLAELLASHESAGSFLATPVLTDDSASATPGEATETFAADRPNTGRPNDLDFLSASERPGALGRLAHYEILEVVGRGGMGIVLKAFDEKLHRVVALKVMARDFATNAAARKRFLREAKAAAAVVHDHIVPIHAIEDAGPMPYLVMQLIDGYSLQHKIDAEGSLELKEVLRIGGQAARGLAAAHKQGLVHRDIKPANLLLENGVQRVKITDFGLARAVDDATVSQAGVIVGTPQYMSPEQADGQPVDYRSDLFSLGSVLYAMCTGRPPFRASGTAATLKRVFHDLPRPIRELNPDIPDWLCQIIEKLHAKKPAERFQSAAEVAEVLEKCLAQVQQPQGAPVGLPGWPFAWMQPLRAVAETADRLDDVLAGAQAAIAPAAGAARSAAEARPDDILEKSRRPWRILGWALALGGIGILRFTDSYAIAGVVMCLSGATLLLQSALGRIRALLAPANGLPKAPAANVSPATEAGSRPTARPGAARFVAWILGLMGVGALVQLTLVTGWLTKGQLFGWAAAATGAAMVALALFFVIHLLRRRAAAETSANRPAPSSADDVPLYRRFAEIVEFMVVGLAGALAFVYFSGAFDADGTLRIETDDPSLIVTVDNRLVPMTPTTGLDMPDSAGWARSVTLVPVRPGRHRVRALMDGKPVTLKNVEVASRETVLLDLSVTKPSPARQQDLHRLQGDWEAVSIRYLNGPELGAAALPLTRVSITDHRMRIQLPGMDSSSEFRLFSDRQRLERNAGYRGATFSIGKFIDYSFTGERLRLSWRDLQPPVANDQYHAQGIPMTAVRHEGVELVLQRVTRRGASLLGRWLLESAEYQGQVVPPVDAQRMFPRELTLKADQYGLIWGDQKHEGTFTIDAEKMPAEIDFSGSVFDPVKPRQMIYELNDERLKLCLPFVGPKADPPRPAHFKTDPQSKNAVLIYRREAAANP